MYRPLERQPEEAGRARSLDDLSRVASLPRSDQLLIAVPANRNANAPSSQRARAPANIFRTVDNANYDSLEHPVVRERAQDALPTYTVYTEAQLQSQRSSLIWTLVLTTVLTLLGSLVSSIIFFHYQRSFELRYERQQRDARKRKRALKKLQPPATPAPGDAPPPPTEAPFG